MVLQNGYFHKPSLWKPLTSSSRYCFGYVFFLCAWFFIGFQRGVWDSFGIIIFELFKPNGGEYSCVGERDCLLRLAHKLCFKSIIPNHVLCVVEELDATAGNGQISRFLDYLFLFALFKGRGSITRSLFLLRCGGLLSHECYLWAMPGIWRPQNWNGSICPFGVLPWLFHLFEPNLRPIPVMRPVVVFFCWHMWFFLAFRLFMGLEPKSTICPFQPPK